MAKKEIIEERELTLAEIESQSLGDNDIQTLFADLLKTPCRYKVLGVRGVKTNFGERFDFKLLGIDGFMWRVSSWNLVSSQKFKPLELIEKDIELVQHQSNPKKIFLKLV